MLYVHIEAYLCTYVRTYAGRYIHACMHTCIHACIHTYIHTCMHAYIHTCIHTYTHYLKIHVFSGCGHIPQCYIFLTASWTAQGSWRFLARWSWPQTRRCQTAPPTSWPEPLGRFLPPSNLLAIMLTQDLSRTRPIIRGCSLQKWSESPLKGDTPDQNQPGVY